MTQMSDEDLRSEYQWALKECEMSYIGKYQKDGKLVYQPLGYNRRFRTLLTELFRRWGESEEKLASIKLHNLKVGLTLSEKEMLETQIQEIDQLQAQVKERDEKIKELQGKI